MRILMVVEQMHLGGLETHMIALCKNLVRRGHTVFARVKYCLSIWAEALARCGVTMVESVRDALPLDIIHAHVWGEAIETSLAWSAEYAVPLAATFHTPTHQDLMVRLAGKAAIIAVSKTIQKVLGDSVTVIENGIDLDQFPSSPFPENRVVTVIGRLSGVRWMMLEAVFQACRQAGVRCRVVGAFLEPEAVGLLRGHPEVEWSGALFDVAPAIRDSEVVLSTSRGIREAMSCGRTAIVLRDLRYGGIVHPDNVEAQRSESFMAWSGSPFFPDLLARDLINLYERRTYMKDLGIWGADYARRNFSAADMALATEELYRRARSF